jgi:hypothetical protein
MPKDKIIVGRTWVGALESDEAMRIDNVLAWNPKGQNNNTAIHAVDVRY